MQRTWLGFKLSSQNYHSKPISITLQNFPETTTMGGSWDHKDSAIIFCSLLLFCLYVNMWEYHRETYFVIGGRMIYIYLLWYSLPFPLDQKVFTISCYTHICHLYALLVNTLSFDCTCIGSCFFAFIHMGSHTKSAVFVVGISGGTWHQVNIVPNTSLNENILAHMVLIQYSGKKLFLTV